MKLIITMKEMIRFNIKANFATSGREYNCDYRTAKKIYEKELLKENGIVVEVSERNHLIDKYK